VSADFACSAQLGIKADRCPTCDLDEVETLLADRCDEVMQRHHARVRAIRSLTPTACQIVAGVVRYDLGSDGRRIAQRDEQTVCGIALTPTQGLARGMPVEDSGGPLVAPVGKSILSRDPQHDRASGGREHLLRHRRALP